ncbi:sulfotransferase family 2 domain-containing protein [uncultured Tateyamaria sp.]|uniref:sulfotransferase family 2 domain-containing protein n=1 Tax=uncultured Tateyamaria sp. TaxID=455651 RepID=UPI00260BFD44|nr:sulfotransferase family 2 domain-containing protein [uncultured Tateyamaria sp.]
MAVVLNKYKLSIMLVPKGASTTIKHVAFEIENGYPFKPFFTNSRRRQIHHLYQSRLFKFDRDMVNWKNAVFAVIRDPVERLLSCHSNRVLHLGELDKLPLTDEDHEKGVTMRPSFGTFVAHLHRYRELSDKIKHHSLPMERFLGGRADRYTRIFDSADLSEFWTMLRERIGTLPEIPHEQTGGRDLKERSISGQTLDRIKQIYARDYDIFGDFLTAKENTFAVS